MRTRNMTGLAVRAGLTLGLAAMIALAPTRPAVAGGDWNDQAVQWQPYEKGLALAKESKKPICLVFYTEWCPHCTNYSSVFHAPEVVEKAKRFVMVRLDKDRHPELSAKYAPDGQYIPRTYFLSSEGKLEPAVHAPRDQFKYFYDERNPASLLAGMEAALERLP